jgi:hypothetical protein
MKKIILGLTALLAMVTFCLTFTSCPQDNEERVLTFTNHTGAIINITCEGSPAAFSLQKASGPLDETKRQEVRRTGKDIVITTISFTPANDDPWRYITLEGNAAPPTKQVKNGVALGSGFIDFVLNSGDQMIGNPYPISKISEIQLGD